jgi:hypothetical protein
VARIAKLGRACSVVVTFFRHPLQFMRGIDMSLSSTIAIYPFDDIVCKLPTHLKSQYLSCSLQKPWEREILQVFCPFAKGSQKPLLQDNTLRKALLIIIDIGIF